MSIVLEQVSKRFGEKTAVDGVSLSVRAGEVFAFLGPNGAGKTTTIKMIVGLLRPDTGRVRICDHLMGSNGNEAKLQMAYVPDLPFVLREAERAGVSGVCSADVRLAAGRGGGADGAAAGYAADRGLRRSVD